VTDYPRIKTVGLSGLLITFGDKLSEPANRAAVAFRSAVDAENWPEVSESTMSLVSVFLVVDLVTSPADAVIDRLQALLTTRDWYAAPLPEGRTLWHVPTVYGTDLAPQLEEAAAVAGVDPEDAIRQISTSRVRVLTIGFAPGQPYMGELSKTWNIPRQQGLTKSVPSGALVIAIQQLIVFTGPTPTGWRHIGQTAFENFRPNAAVPFALNPGDELVFPAISQKELADIRAKDTSGNGGATRETIT
jgi:KipI family sensor histidine kinase inhibitor